MSLTWAELHKASANCLCERVVKLTLNINLSRLSLIKGRNSSVLESILATGNLNSIGRHETNYLSELDDRTWHQLPRNLPYFLDVLSWRTRTRTLTIMNGVLLQVSLAPGEQRRAISKTNLQMAQKCTNRQRNHSDNLSWPLLLLFLRRHGHHFYQFFD